MTALGIYVAKCFLYGFMPTVPMLYLREAMHQWYSMVKKG